MAKEVTVASKPLWARLREAAVSVQETFPAVATLLEQISVQDVTALGDTDLFTLRDSEGEIRAFKQSVTFSLGAGTLVRPVTDGPLVVSAQGYEVWAESAGASVIFPKEVLVDGRWEPNPAVIRDTQNRRILCIYARAVAFRFSSKGIPQVSDWSHCFDLPSYRLVDLLGKAKKCPQAFRLYPNDMKRPEDAGTWACYPFDESTSLWVNTAHDEALTWFAQILNREKKALDFAQTFAKRNALKHLSGLQRAPKDQWTVPVICWRPTAGNIIKWDATQYANLQKTVGGLIDSRGEEFGQYTQIEYQKGSDRASDDENVEALEQMTDPEDQPVDIKPVDAQPQPTDPKFESNFKETVAQFPDEYLAACRQLKITEGSPHTAAQKIQITSLIEQMV